MICRDICSVFDKRLEFDNRPAFGAVDMDPNRSLGTPCPFLIGEMRLPGILPASVRILFPATPRRSPLRLRLGGKHAA